MKRTILQAVATVLLLSFYFSAASQTYIWDQSFNNTNSTTDAKTRAIAEQADGKILVAGDFFNYYNLARPSLVRLNINGTNDASFSPPSINGNVYCIAVQPWDNKILIGGAFTLVNGISRRGVARLEANGTLDLTFNTSGGGITQGWYGSSPVAWSILVKEETDPADRRIIIGGLFERYNGAFIGTRGGAVQTLLNGALDRSLGIENGDVRNMSFDAAGRILLAGEFWRVQGISIRRVARLTRDGNIDPSFNHGGWGPGGTVYVVKAQSDNKVIFGGDFTSMNGISQNYIARLNENGSFDASFATGSGFSGGVSLPDIPNTSVWSLLVANDDKIIVGGLFSSFNGFAAQNIVRLRANGSYDSSFRAGMTNGGFNSAVLTLSFQRALLGEAFILSGGVFTGYDGNIQGRLMRLGNLVTLTGKEITLTSKRTRSGISLLWHQQHADSGVYKITRSEDGRHFNTIGQVPVVQGKTAYVFVDAVPCNKPAFYQVVQEKKSGSHYSNLVRIGHHNFDIRLLNRPSPVLQLINSPGEKLTLELFSFNGQLLQRIITKAKTSEGIQEIRLHNFTGQNLVVRIANEHGQLLLSKTLFMH